MEIRHWAMFNHNHEFGVIYITATLEQIQNHIKSIQDDGYDYRQANWDEIMEERFIAL